MLLEGVGHYGLESGGTLWPSLEAGLRFDEGDAETGLGAEVGAGLRFAAGGGRFGAELSARALVAHEEDEYEEWGVSGALVLEPGPAGRGLSLRLASGYGTTAGGAEQLWEHRDVGGLAEPEAAAPAMRLEATLGYGLNGPGGRGTLTPYAAFGHGDRRSELRLGARLDFGDDLRLDLGGVRRRGEGHDLRVTVDGRW